MSNTDINALISDVVNHNLLDEIHRLLSGDHFGFSGTFYHASLLSNPPNPCLTIDGLGLIGLPLGERDTEAIIASSTSTPFDPGERTIPDKDVQNIWEIEASIILFANPAWEDYVNNTLCSMLCESLGIINKISPLKMKLHKLFLYGTGSQLLSNQHSSKEDGVFARATILLPSAYTGGNIILSHASRTKAIEFSQPPLLSTSILAWYTEVKQEIKPIDSGSCLALSYNLVHSSQDNSPHPSLPDMQDSILQLQDVLKQWKGRQDPPKFIAYLLDHQYTSTDLVQGVNILKGADSHRVTYVRPVAEQLGFRVCLASLDHKIQGMTDDKGREYYTKPRHRIQDQALEEGIPKLRKVYSTTTKISSLVDLKDSSILSTGNINVGEDCLTVRNPFSKDQAPDKATYYSNYDLEYWYKRTCLVLMREEDVDTTLYLSEGAPYVIRMLKKSMDDAFSSYNRHWVERLLKEEKQIATEHVLALLELAINWKDITMWNSIISNRYCTLGVMNLEIIKNSMDIFDFDALKSGYEIVLKHSVIFSQKIGFLSQFLSISPASEKEIVNVWCREEIHKIVLSYMSPEIKDIPTIIRSFGLEDFDKILIPNLKKKENYGFCIALVKTLLQKRQTMVERESSFTAPLETDTHSEEGDPFLLTSTFKDQATVSGLVKQCLLAAVPHWKFQEEPKSAYDFVWDKKVHRIMEIIEQAMELPDLDICRELLIDILKYPDIKGDKFGIVYIPLIPRLRTLLAAKDEGFHRQPFTSFIQVVIGLYMRDVVGKKGELPSVNLRRIGCGCEDCESLDGYIMSYDTDTESFSLVQARRLHLERRLRAASDLCTYEIWQGRPSTIYIKKKPAIIVVSRWLAKQQRAKKFLESIGSDADIKLIMGSRYADVKLAVDGLRSFGSVITNTPSASTSADSAPTLAIANSTVTKGADSTSSSVTAQAQDPVASTSVIGVARHASETGFSQQDAGKRPKV